MYLFCWTFFNFFVPCGECSEKSMKGKERDGMNSSENKKGTFESKYNVRSSENRKGIKTDRYGPERRRDRVRKVNRN